MIIEHLSPNDREHNPEKLVDSSAGADTIHLAPAEPTKGNGHRPFRRLGWLTVGAVLGGLVYGGLFPNNASVSVQDYCDKYYPGRRAGVFEDDPVWSCIAETQNGVHVKNVQDDDIVRDQLGLLAVSHRADPRNPYALRATGWLGYLWNSATSR